MTGTPPPDKNQGAGDKDNKAADNDMSAMTAAVLDMMKNSNSNARPLQMQQVSIQQDEDAQGETKHAFWDTQVSD